MKDHKTMWAWVGAGVVAVVVIIWVATAMMPQQQAPQTPQATGPMPVYAPHGQVTPNFPRGLILDNNAAISQSYSIAYASSTNLYTAIYDSSSTVTSLFEKYKTYLSGNGWTITGTLTTQPTFDVITASSAGGQVQVVVSKQGTGSHVAVGYTAK